MLIATFLRRTYARTAALSLSAPWLATTMLGAVDAAARKEAEEWRAKHEVDYRKEYVPPRRLFALKPGPNTAGSAASNTIVLPKSAPAVVGRFVMNGKSGLDSSRRPASAVTLKGQRVSRAVVLKSRRGEGRPGRARDRRSSPVGAHQRRAPDHPHARSQRRGRADHSAGFQWFPIDDSIRVTGRFIKDPAPAK